MQGDGDLSVGENKSSITWKIINPNYYLQTFSSKSFSVCDRKNNHGICRLGITKSPLEITLENVYNANITLCGEIQLCTAQSTLFTSKFLNEVIANSNPLKWTINNQTINNYVTYDVKLNLESPCYFIGKDFPNAAETKDTARKETPDLSTDLEKLLTESKYSDVEIICSDGEILKCHKALLCARSPVLEAMFSNDFKEVSSGQIKLDYFDTEVVKVIVSLLLIFQSKIH